MLFNSRVDQTVDVLLGADKYPSCSLTGRGLDDDNRGTAILTSDATGQVHVKVSTADADCQTISQQVAAPNSQNSYVNIIAAYNRKDNDSLYNDAYVILTWMQST